MAANLIKIWKVFSVLFIALSLTAVKGNPLSPNCSKTQVFIDTDVGSDYDDGTAIIFALKNSEFQVQFVLTATGDVVSRTRVLAKLLTLANLDYVPIGVGVKGTSSHPVYMSGWADDFNLTDYKGGVFEDGVGQFAKTLLSNPCKDIVMLELAPTSNIPLLFSKYPEVKKKISKVKAMAGSIYRGYDNSSRPTDEYNVKICPKCMQELFQSGLNITITPLDTCGVFRFDTQHFQTFLGSSKAALLSLSSNWVYWCTNVSYYTCVPKDGSDVLFDSIATFLMMSESPNYLNFKLLSLRVTSDGYTVIDTKEGSPINVALTWKDGGLHAMQDIYLQYVQA